MAKVDPSAHSKQLGAIVAKAWKDPAFASRLKSDPKAVLQEHGINLPKNTKVTVLENTDKVIHLAVPPRPSGQLDDEHLKQVAGGGTTSTAGSAGTAACPVSTASSAATAGTAGT